MKKSMTILFVFGMVWAISCTGGGPTNSQQTAANKSNTNAAQTANTASKPASTDTTPMKTSAKDLSGKSADELKGLVGRTMVFETEGLKNWGDEGLTVSYLSTVVLCKGDFSEHKDAIKKFQDAKDFIYVDFKGVADKVEEAEGKVYITLKECTVTKLEK